MQPSENAETGFLRDYLRALGLIWSASPRTTTCAVALAMADAAVLPSQVWITKLIIDRVADVIRASPGAAIDWPSVLMPAGALGLVWATGSVCSTRLGHFRWLLSTQVQHHVEYLILEKVSRLDLAFFENADFHDRMATVLREAYRAHNLVWRSLDLLGALAGLGAMLGLLMRLHPLAVGVLLLACAPAAFASGHFANRTYRQANSHASVRRVSAYFRELLSSREAAKEIRAFQLGGRFLERFHRHWREHTAESVRLQRSRERVGVGLGLLSLSGTLGIWVFAIAEALRSRITLGDVVLVLQASEQVRARFTGLLHTAGEIYENNLFTRDLLQFLDLEARSITGALVHAPRAHAAQAPRPLREGVEFFDVSFRYPGAERYALRGLSCRFLPGETVALAGENGAGKTTLVKLLVRFYDPTEGKICLDGRDLREYDVEDLRRQIGIIFQDFCRFDLTARENIAAGQMDLEGSDERLLGAAAQAGAGPIIEALPAGLDNFLGRRFEGGLDLSGGQWQKIALSRALLRQAQILVLDEPTASLDALAEKELYGRLAELSSGRMTLFVSHRLSTVRTADRIFVLEQGGIIETGTHDELVDLNGRYAEMFRAQAERYRA